MSRRNSTTALPIADRLDAPTEGKAIIYDRQTKDYACFLDRNYLGHADTYSQAEAKISAVYYDQLTHPTYDTARCADITVENVDGMPAVAAAAFGDELAAAGLRIASVDEPGHAYALAGGIYAWVTEVLPFEPTEAELAAYAEEWDQAVDEQQAALEAYCHEWDTAAQPDTLATITERWLPEVETSGTLPPVTADYTAMEDSSEGYITFRADRAYLCVDGPDKYDVSIKDDGYSSAADLRSLIALCSDPKVQAWAGLTPTPTPSITHEQVEDCTVERCGGIALWTVTDEPHASPSIGGLNTDQCSWAQMRSLYTLLSQPQFQQLMGFAPAAPAIDVQPHLCSDEIDADFGQQMGTDYRCGAVEVYFPNTPSTNPGNQPIVLFPEIDCIALEDVVRLLPSLTALVQSAVVQAAWQRWQEQQAAQ